MTHRVISDYTRVDNQASNIKVYVRARPLAEESDQADFLILDSSNDKKIVVKDPEASNRRYGEVSFQFDDIFWTKTSQEEVFGSTCRSQVDHVLNGYNSCCFAYGQTGSGKTYTMFGENGDIRGVIPRSVEYLFQSLAKKTSTSEVAMVCSFLEIYNDQIRDLGKAYLVAMGVESSTSMALFEKTSDIFESIAGKRGNPYFAPAFHKKHNSTASTAEVRPGLKEVQDEYNTMNYEIREDNEGNVFVKDLSLVPVTTMEEVMSLISMGLRVRATHETKMNATSSRSHTVFTITVLQRDKITGQSITGMLNLVDLAGSERLKKSESQGVRLKEALHINTSLTALGKVVMALDASAADKETAQHVPFRDSKLTRVLQNSLGGNSFTSVIATIHPNSSYYEECLSTLQFANRCRNVRNNPRVNYVEDNEDKDRKIRRLMDELTMLRSRLAVGGIGGPGGDGGRSGIGGDLSASKLVALLKRLGIAASLSPDGGIVVNGKRFDLAELGLSASTSETSLVDGGGSTHGAGGGRKDGSGSGSSTNADKLARQIKELKESNAAYNAKAKERKTLVEEQGRELQRLTAELVKCQTTIKHQEHEYKVLSEEKERALRETREFLETKHADEMKLVLGNNKEALQQQQKEIERIPAALKDYTAMLSKTEQMKTAFQGPLRAEFDEHLIQLDKNRLAELATVRNQYEFFLNEKDKALSGFVDSFNVYRTKKSEQLRMAEREIVRLYDYTEQLEVILDNVEKGKYSVQQKQGYRGGRSTTGVMATGIQGGAAAATRPKTSGNQQPDDASNMTGQFGAVQLPTGLRPANPLKTTTLGLENNDLELTRRIVDKHKERVRKLDQMKEDAFQKSLHFAAQTGATAAGVIDPTIQKQIRDLLISRCATGTGVGVAASPTARPIIGDSAFFSRQGSTNNLGAMPPIGGSGNQQQQSMPPKHPNKLQHDVGFADDRSSNNKRVGRPAATLSSENSLHSNASGNSGRNGMVTAPGGMQRNHANVVVTDGDDFADEDQLLSPSLSNHNSSRRQLMQSSGGLDTDLMNELEYLRSRHRLEQITTRKVVEELSGNETLQYIARLESETERLKKLVKDVSAQLHAVKIANASLSRKMEKDPGFGSTAGSRADVLIGTSERK